MPALPPPSMQIGALPPGQSTVTPLQAGPSLQQGFNENPPLLVQQVASASSAAAPANFTVSGITATKGGSFGVLLVAAACSGAPTISTPSGWTAVANASGTSAGNTIAGRIFVFPSLTAGTTSVAIGTLTNINGVACWFGEFSNVYAADSNYATATATNSSATPSATGYTPGIGPVLIVGFESDVTGQAYTAANVGGTWITGTTATSTNGATNAIIRPFYQVTSPVLPPQTSFQLAGTLAGALANVVSALSLVTGVTGPVTQEQPQGFNQSAVGWAWGSVGLGNTKPGGAGMGQ